MTIDQEADKFANRQGVLPSTLIFVGLILAGGGAFLLFLGVDAIRTNTPKLALCAPVSLIPLALGGILVSVGTIRWAIWPLIEKADERD